MKGFIANTDFDWYAFLHSGKMWDEVNFWQPSGGQGFHRISPGEPFLFKLKKPHYAIAGFGWFARHSILPAWLAWETFREANGAPDFRTMVARVEKYRTHRSPRLATDPQYKIGCLMVAAPVFFDERDWIPQPRDWRSTAVQGITYDLSEGEGERVYRECLLRAQSRLALQEPAVAEGKRFGEAGLVTPRLGQGSFRVGVVDAYGRACAVTDEHSLPALEAAHIKPYAEGGEHRVSNGLLLRSDIHRLFDQGYVTVTPEHRFEVSRRLREDFANGRSYYPLHGRVIHLPREVDDWPDPGLLDWHNRQRFLAG